MDGRGVASFDERSGGVSVTLAKWTLEDYHRMVASGMLDDRPVELLSGEIVEMSPERMTHAYLMTEAGEYLSRLVGGQAVVRPAHPITLPGYDSEPEPDFSLGGDAGKVGRL